MKSLNLRITIRVEPKERTLIDKAVTDGRGKSVSDLIRTALAEFLKSERSLMYEKNQQFWQRQNDVGKLGDNDSPSCEGGE